MMDELFELAQQSNAQPKFTVTVVDNDTLETVMVAECDAWTWDQSECSDTLEFPDIFMIRPPRFDQDIDISKLLDPIKKTLDRI